MGKPTSGARRSLELNLPASEHSRFAPEVADSVVGQVFDLDERIAGIGGMVTHTLAADERGLWTKARVTHAEVVSGGQILRVTVEAVEA